MTADGLMKPLPVRSVIRDESLFKRLVSRCEHFVKAPGSRRGAPLSRPGPSCPAPLAAVPVSGVSEAVGLGAVCGAIPSGAGARGLGLEAVAEARMGVDEAAVGHRRFELAAQLAHVHVDRAVAVAQLATPHGAVQLATRNDRAGPPGHRREQLELPHRERQRASVGQHETLVEPDLQFARVQRVRVRIFHRGRHRRIALRRIDLAGVANS